MSDDLLQKDLNRLAHRAELEAGPIAPAGAVVGRARRRRRNLRVLEASLALVVVAAATTGIVLSRPSDHQNVAVSTPAGTKGSHDRTIYAEPAIRAEHRGASSGPAPEGIRAATMRVETSASGITTCAVVSNPVTSAAEAGRRGALRAGATGVAAIWLPNRPTDGVCRSTVTTAPATTAAGLVEAIDHLSRALMSCTAITIEPGRVELVFRYATGKSWAVVTVTLGSCGGAELPDGELRSARALKLAGLDEPAWATSELQFKSTSPTTDRVGHQKLKGGS